MDEHGREIMLKKNRAYSAARCSCCWYVTAFLLGCGLLLLPAHMKLGFSTDSWQRYPVLSILSVLAGSALVAFSGNRLSGIRTNTLKHAMDSTRTFKLLNQFERNADKHIWDHVRIQPSGGLAEEEQHEPFRLTGNLNPQPMPRRVDRNVQLSGDLVMKCCMLFGKVSLNAYLYTTNLMSVYSIGLEDSLRLPHVVVCLLEFTIYWLVALFCVYLLILARFCPRRCQPAQVVLDWSRFFCFLGTFSCLTFLGNLDPGFAFKQLKSNLQNNRKIALRDREARDELRFASNDPGVTSHRGMFRYYCVSAFVVVPWHVFIRSAFVMVGILSMLVKIKQAQPLLAAHPPFTWWFQDYIKALSLANNIVSTRSLDDAKLDLLKSLFADDGDKEFSDNPSSSSSTRFYCWHVRVVVNLLRRMGMFQGALVTAALDAEALGHLLIEVRSLQEGDRVTATEPCAVPLATSGTLKSSGLLQYVQWNGRDISEKVRVCNAPSGLRHLNGVYKLSRVHGKNDVYKHEEDDNKQIHPLLSTNLKEMKVCPMAVGWRIWDGPTLKIETCVRGGYWIENERAQSTSPAIHDSPWDENRKVTRRVTCCPSSFEYTQMRWIPLDEFRIEREGANMVPLVWPCNRYQLDFDRGYE